MVQAAPSSSFEHLAEPVRRWIWRRGWSELRSVQEHAIPPIVGSEADVLIAAPTAGGKTEAAFLPLISRLVGEPDGSPGFKLLYVSPLKALINDQFRRLDDLCEALSIPVHRWHGDVTASKKARARKNPDGILLITPESLEALFVLRGLEVPSLFDSLQAVVIDELHAFLGPERGVHLSSLLVRLEDQLRHRVRRIGLSATLGDMGLAAGYLRPDAANKVVLIQDSSDATELKIQLKGYLRGGTFPAPGVLANAAYGESDAIAETARSGGGTDRQIANHIFDRLRGDFNLVFAGSRQNVELFSDILIRLSDQARLPDQEFYPHHANLSRQQRELVERRLKEGRRATTAVCTSTLELGIDIGEVASVVQLGAPASVASLRQRLGRSGRRTGQPAILRLYVRENAIDDRSHPCEQLRLNLLQATAVLELLLEGWVEPPPSRAMHLSTLVHQVLSVIAQRGGARADELFDILCRRGPFDQVRPDLFVRLLRCLGDGEAGMIEQSPDGVLLLGPQGERTVEHYSFYAVFLTPEEYRVETAGKLLGTLPIEYLLAVGMTIIFSGRRWKVVAIRDREKVIEVISDPAGVPPRFGGDPQPIHDRVAERMLELVTDGVLPAHLDATGQELLSEACANTTRLGLDRSRIVSMDDGGTLILPWKGTVAVQTLTLALISKGLDASISALGRLTVECKQNTHEVVRALRKLSVEPAPDGHHLAKMASNLRTERFHAVLSDDLLAEDVAASRLVADRVPELAGMIVDGHV